MPTCSRLTQLKHFRQLGVRTSSAVFIHNVQWTTDAGDLQDHWFVEDFDSPANRVFQAVALDDFVLDVSGAINGDPDGDGIGWKEYVATTMIADAAASAADGVFADSSHLPFAIPANLYDSPLGPPLHTAYIPHLEAYYNYVFAQFETANQYFIPNIGSLLTTLDRTTGYYEDVHGAMVKVLPVAILVFPTGKCRPIGR